MISNLDLNLAGPSLCHDFWAKPCGPLLRLWWPFGVAWVIKLFHGNWSFWARYGQRLPSKCVWMILCENKTHIRDPTFHHFHGSNGQNKHSHLVKRTHILPTSLVSRAFRCLKDQGFAAASGSWDVCASQTLRLWSLELAVSFWTQSDGAYSKKFHHGNTMLFQLASCFPYLARRAKSHLRTLRQLDHDHVVVHVIFNLISTNLSRMNF